MSPTYLEEVIFVIKAVLGAGFLIIAWGAREWIQSQTEFNRSVINEHRTLHGRITHVDSRLSKLEGSHEVNHQTQLQ